MPLFFFHLREGSRRLDDEEGRELPDAEAARRVAVMNARSIICEEVLLGTVRLDDAIEVQDEAGHDVLEVPFSDAVKVRR